MAERTYIHGVVTIGIHWLPGIPAAVHILSTYRTQLGVAKSLTLSGIFTAIIYGSRKCSIYIFFLQCYGNIHQMRFSFVHIVVPNFTDICIHISFVEKTILGIATGKAKR